MNSQSLDANKKTDHLLERWLLGSDAPVTLADFPQSWHKILQMATCEQEQSLMAFALFGHYQALSENPTTEYPLKALSLLKDISAVSHSLLSGNVTLINQHNPSAYNMAIRLLNSDDAQEDGVVVMVLKLLAEQGYALPPKDYFQYIATDKNRQISHHLNLQNSHQDGYQDRKKNSQNNRQGQPQNKTIAIYQLYHDWQHYSDTWQARLINDEAYFTTDPASDDNHTADDLAIDEDNWVDFMPAFRRQALHNLRVQDPTACRELIAKCFGQEPAEERVKILSVFYMNLSADDVPFLSGLLTDRSKKVIEIANQLLIRAGHFSQTNSDDNAELTEEIQIDLDLLAEGFDISEQKLADKTKSKLKQVYSKKIDINTDKNSSVHHPVIVKAKLYREHKKRNKRRELLKKYGLHYLALALDISLEQLILGWAFNKHNADDNEAFLACASHLPDDLMPVLADALRHYTFDYVGTILVIWYRFTHEQQQLLLASFLQNSELEIRFNELLGFNTILPTQLSDTQTLDFKALQTSPMWKLLLGIGVDKKKHEQHSYLTEDDCIALGLLLPQSLAQETLTFLQDKLKDDYSPNDPMYYAMRLNADLEVINE